MPPHRAGAVEMRLKLRYVVRKQNRRGDVRWYWERPGCKTHRLPNNEPARVAEALRLNAAADAGKAGGKPAEGTVAWAIDAYRNSPQWSRLAPGTRTLYGFWLTKIDEAIGSRPMGSLTPGDVDDMLGRISPSRQAHFRAAFRAIVKIARRHRYLTEDITAGTEVARSRVRDTVAEPDEIERLRKACDDDPTWGPVVWRACCTMLYTGQRPGDVLALRRTQYTGAGIRLTQQKTGKSLTIPCHRDLRAELDKPLPGIDSLLLVPGPDGKAVTARKFWRPFDRIRQAAGLGHLQPRDFRRTAATRLGEIPGMSDADIASITGHQPGSPILNRVYRQRTARQAEKVVKLWESEG